MHAKSANLHPVLYSPMKIVLVTWVMAVMGTAAFAKGKDEGAGLPAIDRPAALPTQAEVAAAKRNAQNLVSVFSSGKLAGAPKDFLFWFWVLPRVPPGAHMLRVVRCASDLWFWARCALRVAQ